VSPKSSGGRTQLSNLALSCPGCNLAKSHRRVGVDSTGKTQAIYNPRAYDAPHLAWHLHFSLDRKSGRIVPRTPTGEATIQLLNVNDRLRIFARKLQIAAGLIA
jgi:hypothetical protein